MLKKTGWQESWCKHKFWKQEHRECHEIVILINPKGKSVCFFKLNVVPFVLFKFSLTSSCQTLKSNHIYSYFFGQTLNLRSRLTITSPFPPRANPSPTLAGRLFRASRRFFWYSSSRVSAAIPLPRVPVIRDTAPAAPPGERNKITEMLKLFLTLVYNWAKAFQNSFHRNKPMAPISTHLILALVWF